MPPNCGGSSYHRLANGNTTAPLETFLARPPLGPRAGRAPKQAGALAEAGGRGGGVEDKFRADRGVSTVLEAFVTRGLGTVRPVGGRTRRPRSVRIEALQE